MKCFIGFQVPKYIAAKNNDNVIFEFMKDGKPIRKWVKKSDIILLTDDKDFFLKTMNQFQAVESAQQKLVDDARKNLNESMETFTETINSEINEFNEIRDSKDVPCILKDL
jgi:hypothetical protein